MWRRGGEVLQLWKKLRGPPWSLQKKTICPPPPSLSNKIITRPLSMRWKNYTASPPTTKKKLLATPPPGHINNERSLRQMQVPILATFPYFQKMYKKNLAHCHGVTGLAHNNYKDAIRASHLYNVIDVKWIISHVILFMLTVDEGEKRLGRGWQRRCSLFTYHHQ